MRSQSGQRKTAWQRHVIGALAAVMSGSILALVPALPAVAAVSHVQSTGTYSDSTGTSISQAFSSNNTASNTIVVAVSWYGSATVTCSDTRGNTYANAVSRYSPATGNSLAVCYASNIASGANTVTATLSGSSLGRRILVHEYSGLASSSPVDVATANVTLASPTAVPLSSTKVSPNFNGDLIFGAASGLSPSTFTAGTNFTKRATTGSERIVSEDLIQATATDIDATFQVGGMDAFGAAVVAFKAAGASAASHSPGARYVQSAQSMYGGPVSSSSLALSSNLTAGDTAVASVNWDTASATLTCSDTQGNTYSTVETTYDSSSHIGLSTCYATNVSAGPNTVTATLSSSQNDMAITLTEYTGVLTAAAYDTSASNFASASTATDNGTSTAQTTTMAGDLIYGVSTPTTAANVGYPIAGTGFTSRTYGIGWYMLTEDKVQSTAGSVAATFTWTGAESYIAQMVAFRPAEQGNTTTISAVVDPSFTFAVNAQSTGVACNGIPVSTIATGSTAVTFGHLGASGRAFGVQQLQVTTNAASGYVVYLRSTSATTSVLKGSTSHAFADSGAVTLPSAGSEFFGYSTDSTTAAVTSGQLRSVPTTGGNNVVGNGSAGSASNNCVVFAVGVASTTPADSYSATVVYTAIPTF